MTNHFATDETEVSISESTPVRREIVVSAPVDAAFALFTAQVGAWWPLADRHILSPDSSLALEGGRLVERSRSRASVWAEVIEWEPPTSLRLDFHPGADRDQATDLLLMFAPAGDGTRVALEHRGWERLAGPEAREQVAEGWDAVLDSYRCRVDAEDLAGPVATPRRATAEEIDLARDGEMPTTRPAEPGPSDAAIRPFRRRFR